MKYIVTEIQKFADGTVAIAPPVIKDTREEADNAYYTMLAYAALSGLPKHGAMIATEDCRMVVGKCYNREQTPTPGDVADI